MIQDFSRPGYEACTGCKLCVLPCPVFQQTRDLRWTLMGRARAMQGGASAEEVAESLGACVVCGACEPVCPEEIDTVGRTLLLRAELAASGHARSAAAMPRPHVPDSEVAPFARGRGVLLAGPALAGSAAHFNAVTRALGPRVVAAVDDGRDLARAIEAGDPIDPQRAKRFTDSLAGARELLVAEGILASPLRRLLPGMRVRGLGEALLDLPSIRNALRPGDFYVVETRAFHSDYQRLVRLYDDARAASGCAMNLDLHRIAIPTGATSLQTLTGAATVVSAPEQIRWLLEGREISRIVCESLDDANLLGETTRIPVVHLAMLAAAESAAA